MEPVKIDPDVASEIRALLLRLSLGDTTDMDRDNAEYYRQLLDPRS